MSTILIIPNPSGPSTYISVDAVPQEKHSHRAIVTDNPVEEGVNTSDHYKADVDRFSLDLVFSDTPVVPYPDFTDGVVFRNNKSVLTASSKSDRTQRVYDLLLQLMADGVLIEVVTSRRRYTNVAIEKLDVDQNAQIGKSFQPRMEAKALRVPRTTTAEAPVPVRPRGRPRNNAGSQNGTTTTEGDSATNQSIWHRATN